MNIPSNVKPNVHFRKVLSGYAAKVRYFERTGDHPDCCSKFDVFNEDTPLLEVIFNQTLKSDSIHRYCEEVAAAINVKTEGAINLMFDNRILYKSVNFKGYTTIARSLPKNDKDNQAK